MLRIAFRDRSGDGPDVAGEGVERVVAGGIPVALAVAAQIGVVRAPAVGRERAGGVVPRMAGLATAVEQRDRRTVVRPGDVERERQRQRVLRFGDAHAVLHRAS